MQAEMDKILQEKLHGYLGYHMYQSLEKKIVFQI